MKRNIVIFSLIIYSLLCGQAMKAQCTNLHNAMDTYWHYRYRLVHYFMQVGMDSGKSIPAYIRNGGNDTIGCNNLIWWSDQGRNMGYYISTLATEYYLLKQNGQNTNETVMELFYVLHAVFRLDSAAMTGWVQAGNSVSGTVFPGYTGLPITWPGQGYMMTDDVPGNFYNKVDTAPYIASTRTNPLYNGCGAIGSGTIGPVAVVSSAYSSSGNNYANVNGSSQDNYFALLMGLTLCEKLLSDSIYSFYNSFGTVNFATQYTDLRHMAIAEGSAIMEYIINCDFQLTYPDGSTPIGLGGGADYAYCNPLENIADNWFGFSNATSISCGFVSDNLWYNYGICELTLPIVIPPASNVEMGAELAAMSNRGGIYGDGCPHVDSLIQQLGNYTEYNLAYCNAGIGWFVYADPSVFAYLDNEFGEDLLFNSVYQILYPNNQNFAFLPLCRFQDIIYSAPYDGPFHHVGNNQPNSDYGGCGWGALNRFIWGPSYQIGGTGFSGNFNGLDYMLFFNLYCIISQMETQNPTYIPSACIPYTYPGKLYLCAGDTNTYGYDTIPVAIWGNDCNPIYVNQLNVTSSGGLWLSGTEQSFIDLNPTSGNIIISSGSFFDALCFGSCCEASPYLYEPDSGAVHDKAPKKRVDSTANYQMNSEFAPKPNYDAIIAFPNPFINQTTFEFAIKETTPVSISIYNVSGGKMEDVFINQTYNQGNYIQTFNGSNLASGTYLAIMTTKGDRKTFKIVKD